MQRDYTFSCLVTMPRHELEEFSHRVVSRMVPEETMQEIFTFDQEETTDQDRMQTAQLDAMLRLSAVALGEVTHAFSESENAQQNSLRMMRLILWHTYAMLFNLEEAVSLEQHCELVEKILAKPLTDALNWLPVLSKLLSDYAAIAAKK
ncbi:exoribonuclease R [Aliivibrio fischeri]|uniref:exoribonuclease R n=1 Tax=Aliivibrio fischeri TaxID=668 RepID=UPI001F1B9666|nr:exoribonuclease R [Aliivibrio fischeri]MCE7564844.1 exoribonuclease R [Aliivibrio fischeri]MCE7576297.1 exoribonuclease R [Aliivibrio fischeri]MCE7588587.1 exoribonuclease R [Aliivibrio fischeri]